MDEAYKSVIQFAQNDESDPERIAQDGEPLLVMLVGRLDNLGDQTGISEFAMGGMVNKYRESGAWNSPLVRGDKDPWKFGDFCRDILKMSQQKAMILRKNWENAETLGISPELVDDIGWNPTSQILKVAKTRDEALELIEKCKNAKSVSAFLEDIKTNGNGKHERIPKKSRKLKLTETDERFFDETIERAAERMGLEANRTISTEDALLTIFKEWRQDHAGE